LIRRRLANAYVSVLISIGLVLLLVGTASLFLVNARSVSDYFKENLQVTVLMKSDVTDVMAMDFQSSLDAMPGVKSTRFVSREQGAEEMKAMLGEDFLSVFSSSPIPASIDITLEARYVSADSINVVKSRIMRSPLVDEVDYQQNLLDALNANLHRIAMVLAVFIALLLFISFVLINNTVRLSVFSKRFTIHTMKLVGATRSFIRAPFLVQSVFQGLFAAILAIIIMVAILFFIRTGFSQLFMIFRLDLLLVVMGIMIASGIVICLIATYFGVNRLVSLSNDELYY